MLYKTHKSVGVCLVLIVFPILYMSNFLMIDGNYYFQLGLIYIMSKWGSVYPDLDHPWDLVKDKTAINRVLNLIIKSTGGVHRGKHTHCWDINILIFGGLVSLFSYLYSHYETLVIWNNIQLTNFELGTLKVMFIGIMLGVFSHLLADMLNGVGVYVFCVDKKRRAFVPRQLFGFKFNTGDAWEKFVFKTSKLINYIAGILCLIYPFYKLF